MELRLERLYLKKTYTVGKLYIDNKYFCDTIEDRVRDMNQDGDLLDPGEEKISGKTAIPYGVYDIILSVSQRFKRVLPLLLNVRHFEGIRIHKGITAVDSAGCIIVGKNKIRGGVLNSKEYEMKLVQLMVDALYSDKLIRIKIICITKEK